MRLTRRVTFSSGHRYWLNALSAEQNRALFGPIASPFNHGHNYVLDVSADGEPDAEKGMVVNIKDIDEVIRSRVVSQFDLKSINDEIPAFADRAPSLENLLPYIASTLAPYFAGADNSQAKIPAVLTHLRLEEMPSFWAELDLTTNMVTITRVYEFAASHRLHVPSYSEERNVELFGKCNNPSGHGHNYLLEVTVGGEVDPTTGMIVDICAIDEAVNREVVGRYDHKNLNVDLPEFAGRVTTSETVVQEIWNRLENTLPATLHRVRLFETARSVFEVSR